MSMFILEVLGGIAFLSLNCWKQFGRANNEDYNFGWEGLKFIKTYLILN